MKQSQFDKLFMERAMADPTRAIADFKRLKRAVAVSNAVYLGKPCGVLYMPKFYSAADFAQFKLIVDQMMALCRRMVDLYFSDPTIRRKYAFDKRLERLILKESPYKSAIPMARFDFFYYGVDDYKFCELNTDGSSAMNEDMVLAGIFSRAELINELAATHDITSFELFDSWVRELQNIYSEATGRQDKPVVAIVDFVDKGSTIEFEEFLARFVKFGYEAYIVDPRALTYCDGLYYGDTKIDVVYRRLVTRDMMARIDEIAAFEAACLDDKTIVVGNIRSQIVHTKWFFKLLYDDDVRAHFDAATLAFIDAHIPETRDMTYLAEHVETVVANRADYILKPVDYYGSKGVYAGRDHDAAAWRGIIDDCLDQPYIVQRYCRPALSDNIDLQNDRLVVDRYSNITGVFVYNEKPYGVYSRAGKKAILSGIHDVYTLPTFMVK